jgi:hypothetical protein
MESGMQLEGWDHFEVPRPFSRVAIAFGEGIEVPHSARDEEIEVITRRIEASLNCAHREAEALLLQSRRKTEMTIHTPSTSSEMKRIG